ncbi:type II toxin-antitoxin system RelE/ParE family toxin [Clostridium algidicarnis]|uniref:type II toxin-antitoxin system RelE/ParE family toxin n=1 Tax=Clostridium algidicarnis TaxID=37659 RepID=UPI001623308E|nr:type II toxin-antitoxin system RelE/ParE family toxin [Clostridium algidicarnis]MBB6698769.1 type II toxin-antitoxin system RelE/ParE family toxin [Clostridium algidicarnis]
MSMYDIQITEPAEKDLYEIGAYISKELLDPETVKRVISEIAKGVNSLEDILRSVLVADDRLDYKGIRKIMVDNYIVFYIVTEESKTVTIIRILYSRRDWINLL